MNQLLTCSSHGAPGHFARAAQAVIHALDIAPPVPDVSLQESIASIARNRNAPHISTIQLTHQVGSSDSCEVLTFCDSCYQRLYQTQQPVSQVTMQKRKPMRRPRRSTRPETATSVRVSHLLHVLHEQVSLPSVRRRLSQSLAGLTIFPYYGCQRNQESVDVLRANAVFPYSGYQRQIESVDPIGADPIFPCYDYAHDDNQPDPTDTDTTDTSRSPTHLAELMVALGANVVEDALSIHCCTHATANSATITSRVETIIMRAQMHGANAIVSSCSTCMHHLDSRQVRITRPVPVFSYTQLVGLALGLPREALGLDEHMVDPMSVLAALR
ncbi:MAG: hypothetical protein HC837_15725 [Chloroflexaceae bacterium]|nr:hypothetical protein [Chloroflexaceae bacterium]